MCDSVQNLNTLKYMYLYTYLLTMHQMINIFLFIYLFRQSKVDYVYCKIPHIQYQIYANVVHMSINQKLSTTCISTTDHDHKRWSKMSKFFMFLHIRRVFASTKTIMIDVLTQQVSQIAAFIFCNFLF